MFLNLKEFLSTLNSWNIDYIYYIVQADVKI